MAEQIIQGHRRSTWVRYAARVLESSSDAGLKFLITAGKTDEFIRVARPAFARHEPGIVFTAAELRRIFRYLERAFAKSPSMRRAM